MSDTGVTDHTGARILVVCTANVCRSPVAERLLARHLASAGIAAGVRSAGTVGGRLDVHPHTVVAAAGYEVDLTDHVSRRLTGELLGTEGADLVVTMAREHLREVVALDPDAWPRTFTLKELARRALDAPPTAPRGDPTTAWSTWRTAIADGRRAADLLRPDPADDVADPYGGPARHHAEMVAELDALTRRVAQLLPRT
jgi:protein-tyrosine phosphatase